MSLENEMKKLREAIVDLNNIILATSTPGANVTTAPEEPAPIANPEPVAPPPPEEPAPIAPTPEDPPVAPPPPPTQPEDPVISEEQVKMLHDRVVLTADTHERAEKVVNLVKSFRVDAINDLRESQVAGFLGGLEGIKS